jgi:small GTP-binding protein
MDRIDTLTNIADFLGRTNVVNELNVIRQRSEQENSPILLPLVGEFSSGKTTLLNALLDNKKLETATKPTTATIYEVHFGCDTCRAQVVTEDGTLLDIDDISNIKNEEMANAKVVTVFDTSTRVPSSTILVDTPGLSSPDPKHKQTLVEFLPKADGILLVTDINQQITRSLTDFIATMKLSNRPIYLILTKSDTKSAQDIDTAKHYISENCKIPLQQMAVVSAAENNLDELYSLLDSIQKNKKGIIQRVDDYRIKKITEDLSAYIAELMKASSSDKDLEDAIRNCKHELDKIIKNIDLLIGSMSEQIADCDRATTRKFEDEIFNKLGSLVSGKSTNYDGEAISAINTTSTLLLNEYKSNVKKILHEKAQSQRGSENEIPLSSLDNLDINSLQLSGLSYNLDLNTMGHEYDGMIKTGVIAAAAVGAVYAIGVAAAGTAAAGTAAAVKNVDTAIDIADTATDVGSIISNEKIRRKLNKALDRVEAVKNQYGNIVQADAQMGQQAGSNKGMLDGLIGIVTDKMMSKPKRMKAISNYIDSTLLPEFRFALNNISMQLETSIGDALKAEASELIEQKTASLNQLRTEMKEKKALFDQRMAKLREYKTLLLTI